MELDQRVIEGYLARLTGQEVRVENLHQLGGEATGAAALKAFGYGRPLCIDFRVNDELRRVVLRQVNRNGFGHERDADRIAEVWLNFGTFNRMVRHVPAVDMVGVTHNGQLESLGHVQDLLLLTDYAPGTPYAEDLLRIRNSGVCGELDIRRAQALAGFLAELHAVAHDDPLLWRRRLRDLVGDGEGIMGLADSYPADFALATSDDLRMIEEAANRWRWRLKPLWHRLRQVHGDFHPFNILFSESNTFYLLDRSRGEWGEPADDVSCLAINYLFFSLQRYDELAGPFAELYNAFWERYLSGRTDPELPGVIQPWFAWRALVLASPQWYPTLRVGARHKLLTFAQRVLDEEEFQWHAINQYLTR
ncbi:MAG: aminoglycoside phosphotransferase [Chloroflexi bacterium]|nr:MAG: aminoglycoside phosphotransferase [Chloroflexota bacterium]